MVNVGLSSTTTLRPCASVTSSRASVMAVTWGARIIANGYNPRAFVHPPTPLPGPQEAGLTIQERASGSVTILDLNGKLVLGDGDTLLKDKIHSLVFQGRKQIVLNMGDVSFVDSTGLGALVATFVTAKNNGGQIKLVNLTKRLHDLRVI